MGSLREINLNKPKKRDGYWKCFQCTRTVIGEKRIEKSETYQKKHLGQSVESHKVFYYCPYCNAPLPDDPNWDWNDEIRWQVANAMIQE